MFFFLTLLASCNSEDDTNESYIDIPIGTFVADIDGIETPFNADTKAYTELIEWDFQQTGLMLSIEGNHSPEETKNILIWFLLSL